MIRVYLLIFFMAFGFSALAQPPKKPAVKNPAVKGFKPPVLKSTLGIYSDSAIIFAEEGKQLIGTPLRISDAKNGKYMISSYQFMYKKTGVTEEENEDGPTGKTKPTSTITADLFRSTPLPGVWVTNVAEQLKKGDELFFFDIIVKDEKDRLMFAPNLLLKIK